ncbi:hypothetical protein KY360_03550 [Candidatus Woesearchaeota archaeon]|nr:hypothetical protein [Candidatus Woesearchaeota archaeon]
MKSRIIVPRIATIENVALELGDVVSVRNLAIAPLYGDSSFNDGAILIGEAIEKAKTPGAEGKFTITESDEVQSLTIKNELGKRVFIAEGQVVEGDSQNRMAVYSTLIPAYSSGINIPVRCVQHRQGLRTASRYSGSHTVIMPSLRGNEPDQTWTTMITRDTYRPSEHTSRTQHTTWDTITHATQVLNRTRILDLRDVRKENYCDVIANARLEDYLEGLRQTAEPGQIGYIAAVGRSDGKMDLYADVFGSHNHLSGLYEKLLSSVAFVARLHNQDSIDKHRREIDLKGVNQDGLTSFLENIAKAQVDKVRKVGEPQTPLERENGLPSYMWLDGEKEIRRTVGEGTLYRLKTEVDGSALVVENNYAQVFAKHILN